MSKAANTHCPWSGDPISDDALTTYRGRTVGFCNTGCRDKFDQATTIFDQDVAQAPGDMKSGLRRLAHYNKWFNENLLSASAQLSDEAYRRDVGAFFTSVHGTLNHIMVWDVTWLQRFKKHYITYEALEAIMAFPSPTSHDQIMFETFSALKTARCEIDNILAAFIEETSETDFDATFSYTISTGETFRKNFGGMIQHLFNHQTHHRGQVTAFLYQLGIDPGVTDLLAKLPEEKL